MQLDGKGVAAEKIIDAETVVTSLFTTRLKFQIKIVTGYQLREKGKSAPALKTHTQVISSR